MRGWHLHLCDSLTSSWSLTDPFPSSFVITAKQHSFGYRARTRHLFARKFRQHGPIKLSTYLRPFHAGDIVDIKANAAEQKGMPHKCMSTFPFA